MKTLSLLTSAVVACALLLHAPHLVCAQSEVLSVTSFRECVILDTSLGGVPGVGNTLNCTPASPGADPPVVTTLDLRIVPGLSTGSEFNIDLTVVLNNEGASSTTSASASTCDPVSPGSQLCVTTETARLRITSSKAAFAYALERQPQFSMPYCYASIAQFEQYAPKFSAADATTAFSFPQCFASPTYTSRCSSQSPATSPPPTDSLSCWQMAQALTGAPFDGVPLAVTRTLNPFHTAIFTDAEAQYLQSVIPCQVKDSDNAGFDSTTMFEILDGVPTCSTFGNNLCQGNLYGMAPKQGDAGGASVERLCCQSVPESMLGYCDARTMDVRIPALRPYPSMYGWVPENLFDMQKDSASDYTRTVTQNDQMMWNGEIAAASSVGCSGIRCEATVDKRMVLKNAVGSAFAPFVLSQQLIAPIPPSCSVYKVGTTPKVAITVDIELQVDVNVSGVVQTQTETIQLTNFQASVVKSSQSKLVRARFENVASVNSALGPSIDGYVVVCGRSGLTNGPDFIDMRYLVPREAGTGVDSVPQNVNPWPNIIEQWNEVFSANSDGEGIDLDDSLERTNFFPHPYDYVAPGTFGKPADQLGIPGDAGQAMWFFVQQDVAAREWGTGCNQVGMSASWSSSSSNQETMCRLPTHECVPGVGKFYAGGEKLSVPCSVASWFALASGGVPPRIYNPILSDDDGFDQLMENALNFVPNDLFATQQTSTTNTTSTLYNQMSPNFWLSSATGPTLMYESQSASEQLSATVSAEIIIDVVGTFVSYEQQVAKGRIVVEDNFACLVTRGQTSTVVASVENLSQPGVGVTTSYELQLNCNETASGISVDNPDQIVNNVAPNTTSDPVTFGLTQNGMAAQKATCILQLFSATDVVQDPLMDTRSLTCGIPQSDVPPIFNSSAGVAPPVTPTDTACTGWCNLTCYTLEGKPYNSVCFWLAMIIPFTAIVLAITSTGLIISFYTEDQDRVRKFTDEGVDAMDQARKQDARLEREEIEERGDVLGKLQKDYGVKLGGARRLS